MRFRFYNRLKERYKNVSIIYGYITKNTRIRNNLPKQHYIEVLCVTRNSSVERLKYYFYEKQIRIHNRQIHKANIVKGFRLFDKVKFEEKKTGYFDLRTLDGASVHKSASCNKLKLLETRKGLLTERRECVSYPLLVRVSTLKFYESKKKILQKNKKV